MFVRESSLIDENGNKISLIPPSRKSSQHRRKAGLHRRRYTYTQLVTSTRRHIGRLLREKKKLLEISRQWHLEFHMVMYLDVCVCVCVFPAKLQYISFFLNR